MDNIRAHAMISLGMPVLTVGLNTQACKVTFFNQNSQNWLRVWTGLALETHLVMLANAYKQCCS